MVEAEAAGGLNGPKSSTRTKSSMAAGPRPPAAAAGGLVWPPVIAGVRREGLRVDGFSGGSGKEEGRTRAFTDFECFFSWRNSFCLLRGFSRSRRVAAADDFFIFF